MADTDPRRGLLGGRVRYRTSVLAFMSLAWFLFNTGRLVLPPLAVPIQETLAIDNAGFGFAITVLWAMYAIMQFVAGVSTDTLGSKTVIVGSLAVVGPAFALLGLTGSYPVFLLTLALVGVGGSFFYIVSRTYPSELYGEAKGRAIGIVTAAGNGAGVLAPLIATAVLAISWRAPFAVVGGGLLLVAGAFHVIARGEYTVVRPDLQGATSGAYAEVTKAGVPLILVAYSMFGIAWQGSVAFMPLFFYEAKGFDLGLANSALALFFLMGVFVKPMAGWLSDTVGRRWVASGALLGAGVSIITLALGLQSRLAVLVAVGFYGATILSFSPVMQAYLIEIFDQGSTASSFGLARTTYMLVGSTGPTLVGLGSESIGFTATFALLGANLLVGTVVLLFATGRLAIESPS